MDAETFFAASRLDPDASLSGTDLQKVFWRFRALEKELERQKAFWQSTNEALSTAFLRVQQELALARSIQQSLLPPGHPSLSGLRVVCYCDPAQAVGGDFYDYGVLPEERIALAVGDVSGKGLPAAFLMAICLAYLDAAVEENLAPPEVLTRLDRELVRYTGSTRQTCALCYAEIDGRTLQVVNAGGIPPYVRRADGRVERVRVGGLPLGTGAHILTDYRAVQLDLAPEDLCIFTSDGVVEANASRADLFGFGRLEQAIARAPASDPQGMLDHLTAEISAFVGDAQQHDDITIVVCQLQA